VCNTCFGAYAQSAIQSPMQGQVLRVCCACASVYSTVNDGAPENSIVQDLDSASILEPGVEQGMQQLDASNSTLNISTHVSREEIVMNFPQHAHRAEVYARSALEEILFRDHPFAGDDEVDRVLSDFTEIASDRIDRARNELFNIHLRVRYGALLAAHREQVIEFCFFIAELVMRLSHEFTLSQAREAADIIQAAVEEHPDVFEQLAAYANELMDISLDSGVTNDDYSSSRVETTLNGDESRDEGLHSVEDSVNDVTPASADVSISVAPNGPDFPPEELLRRLFDAAGLAPLEPAVQPDIAPPDAGGARVPLGPPPLIRDLQSPAPPALPPAPLAPQAPQAPAQPPHHAINPLRRMFPHVMDVSFYY